MLFFIFISPRVHVTDTHAGVWTGGGKGYDILLPLCLRLTVHLPVLTP